MSELSHHLPWARYSRVRPSEQIANLQQQRPCPLCDAQGYTTQLCLNDFQFFDDGNAKARITHQVVQCDSCGFLYTNPCYTAEGFRVLFAKAGQSYGHSEGRCQEQADWLLREVPGCDSVVDIGCGSGDFLSALPERITRIGFDIDTPSIEAANQSARDVMFVEGDYGADFDPPDAQIYTLFHVLEHLPDPMQTLKQLRNKCRKKSLLVVEVPVIDRAEKEQSQDIVGFFTVQHLSHFSRATLKAMLKASGWEVVISEMMPGYNGYRVLVEPCDALLELPNTNDLLQSENDLGRYMDVWQNNLERANKRVSAIPTDTKVLIWGAGQHTEYLALMTCLFANDRQFLLLDNDPLKQGTTMHGIPVMSPDLIGDEVWCDGDEMVVISTYGGQPAVADELVRRGMTEQRIIKLYDYVNRY